MKHKFDTVMFFPAGKTLCDRIILFGFLGVPDQSYLILNHGDTVTQCVTEFTLCFFVPLCHRGSNLFPGKAPGELKIYCISSANHQ